MSDNWSCPTESLTSWAKMFDCIDPFFYGYVGVAMAMFFSIIGAGL